MEKWGIINLFKDCVQILCYIYCSISGCIILFKIGKSINCRNVLNEIKDENEKEKLKIEMEKDKKIIKIAITLFIIILIFANVLGIFNFAYNVYEL